METRDVVEGLLNCLQFSESPTHLNEAMQTRVKCPISALIISMANKSLSDVPKTSGNTICSAYEESDKLFTELSQGKIVRPQNSLVYRCSRDRFQ